MLLGYPDPAYVRDADADAATVADDAAAAALAAAAASFSLR